MERQIEQQLLRINHSKGRNHKIDAIVFHIMEGTMTGTLSHFNDVKSQVSAHYGISKTGHIVQYVLDEDTAWHAGKIVGPRSLLVIERAKAGVTPNAYSIGIEHEGMANDTPTREQMLASVWLVNRLCRKYNIPLDRTHMIEHREIRADKTCPGKLDVYDIIKGIKLLQAYSPPTKPQHPLIVWSPFFNDYLVVTDFKDDNDWAFVTLKEIRESVQPRLSTISLSTMSLHP